MIQSSIANFLETFNRSPLTIRAYRNALSQFVKTVGEDAELNTESYTKFLVSLKTNSPSTQRQYKTAVLGLYKFCKSGNLMELVEATQHYTHKPGKRIVNFNREGIEKVISYCANLHGDLFALRDRAFVLTMVDTGLRIAEACALKRGDIDWSSGRAVIIGKGDKQAVIRFSKRSLRALKDYLSARGSVDPNSRTPLASQPLFASHDIRASKKLTSISQHGMRIAIKGSADGKIIGRITEAGVDRSSIRIHDFRHYFVTMTYIRMGDLKLSQELARHESISTTNRYAHFGGETDIAYNEIFNQDE